MLSNLIDLINLLVEKIVYELSNYEQIPAFTKVLYIMLTDNLLPFLFSAQKNTRLFETALSYKNHNSCKILTRILVRSCKKMHF